MLWVRGAKYLMEWVVDCSFNRLYQRAGGLTLDRSDGGLNLDRRDGWLSLDGRVGGLNESREACNCPHPLEDLVSFTKQPQPLPCIRPLINHIQAHHAVHLQHHSQLLFSFVLSLFGKG